MVHPCAGDEISEQARSSASSSSVHCRRFQRSLSGSECSWASPSTSSRSTSDGERPKYAMPVCVPNHIVVPTAKAARPRLPVSPEPHGWTSPRMQARASVPVPVTVLKASAASPLQRSSSFQDAGGAFAIEEPQAVMRVLGAAEASPFVLSTPVACEDHPMPQPFTNTPCRKACTSRIASAPIQPSTPVAEKASIGVSCGGHQMASSELSGDAQDTRPPSPDMYESTEASRECHPRPLLSPSVPARVGGVGGVLKPLTSEPPDLTPAKAGSVVEVTMAAHPQPQLAARCGVSIATHSPLHQASTTWSRIVICLCGNVVDGAGLCTRCGRRVELSEVPPTSAITTPGVGPMTPGWRGTCAHATLNSSEIEVQASSNRCLESSVSPPRLRPFASLSASPRRRVGVTHHAAHTPPEASMVPLHQVYTTWSRTVICLCGNVMEGAEFCSRCGRCLKLPEARSSVCAMVPLASITPRSLSPSPMRVLQTVGQVGSPCGVGSAANAFLTSEVRSLGTEAPYSRSTYGSPASICTPRKLSLEPQPLRSYHIDADGGNRVSMPVVLARPPAAVASTCACGRVLPLDSAFCPQCGAPRCTALASTVPAEVMSHPKDARQPYSAALSSLGCGVFNSRVVGLERLVGSPRSPKSSATTRPRECASPNVLAAFGAQSTATELEHHHPPKVCGTFQNMLSPSVTTTQLPGRSVPAVPSSSLLSPATRPVVQQADVEEELKRQHSESLRIEELLAQQKLESMQCDERQRRDALRLEREVRELKAEVFKLEAQQGQTKLWEAHKREDLEAKRVVAEHKMDEQRANSQRLKTLLDSFQDQYQHRALAEGSMAAQFDAQRLKAEQLEIESKLEFLRQEACKLNLLRQESDRLCARSLLSTRSDDLEVYDRLGSPSQKREREENEQARRRIEPDVPCSFFSVVRQGEDGDGLVDAGRKSDALGGGSSMVGRSMLSTCSSSGAAQQATGCQCRGGTGTDLSVLESSGHASVGVLSSPRVQLLRNEADDLARSLAEARRFWIDLEKLRGEVAGIGRGHTPDVACHAVSPAPVSTQEECVTVKDLPLPARAPPPRTTLLPALLRPRPHGSSLLAASNATGQPSVPAVPSRAKGLHSSRGPAVVPCVADLAAASCASRSPRRLTARSSSMYRTSSAEPVHGRTRGGRTVLH